MVNYESGKLKRFFGGQIEDLGEELSYCSVLTKYSAGRTLKKLRKGFNNTVLSDLPWKRRKWREDMPL